MPSAGLVIGTVVRSAGSAGQALSPIVCEGAPGAAPGTGESSGPGPPRLSQATIAFTRGSHWPM